MPRIQLGAFQRARRLCNTAWLATPALVNDSRWTRRPTFNYPARWGSCLLPCGKHRQNQGAVGDCLPCTGRIGKSTNVTPVPEAFSRKQPLPRVCRHDRLCMDTRQRLTELLIEQRARAPIRAGGATPLRPKTSPPHFALSLRGH